MSSDLRGWECVSCGHVVYPSRLLCPRCACSSWRAIELRAGTVTETTVRRRRVREDRREPHGDWGAVERISLASVLTDAGPVVTARLFTELEPGVRVTLAEESGSPVARTEEAR